jgi:plasmid stabilization system protein ParE
MSLSLRLHPAAQRELDEATAYYDAESPGLGDAFLDEVERAFAQILAFPEASPLGRPPLRVKILLAFPYSVHYAIDGELLHVLALAHHSRRPYYWRGRE